MSAFREICVILTLGNIYSHALFLCRPYCVDLKFENRICTRGCIEGYWGDQCLHKCPSTCSEKSCNRTNGLCNSCPDGHYGDTCTKKCYWSKKCSGGKCNKRGTCPTGCISGYYGSYCMESCGNCSSGTCDDSNGYCNVCNTGYYGGKCDRKCNNKCLNQECRKNDGYCKNGCDRGFYGSFCNLSCSDNCAQPKCKPNGDCIGGCKPNWTGEKCDNPECNKTHQGPKGDQLCSADCLNLTCFSNNGSCIKGIQSNSTDDKLSSDINLTSENCSKPGIYLALYGVITILFLSIFINIFLIARNVRQNVSDNEEQDTNQRNPTLYANTIYDGVEDNAEYQNLGQLSQPSHYEELMIK